MIIHIVVVANRPIIVLTGISRPLILMFQPSLNGRSNPGFLALRLRIEAWANIKANSEPKAYRAPMFLKVLAAKNPGVKMSRATMPNMRMET